MGRFGTSGGREIVSNAVTACRMKDTELQELYSLRNEYRSLKYDLRNIELLCEELGNPQRSFRSVLVAGTNGKGSVAQWLCGMVPDAGLYTSPHLEQLNERISIGFRQISDRDLRFAADEVRSASDRCASHLLYPLTYFERVTAMAFCYFRNRVSHVVLEVGLGGRLDATNVVSQDVSVITSIGLDHQEHLGATHEEIAFEKAGIIKQCEPVVTGPRCDFAAIRKKAGNRLIETRTEGIPVRELGDGYFDFDLTTAVREYRGVRPSLAGRHQVENAAVAINAAECMERLGWPVSGSSIVRSLETSFWPGRLERISVDPPILIDGAHNPDAAQALARHLGQYHSQGVSLIFGAMSGKDCRGMLEVLRPHCSTLILTKPSNDRAIHPSELSYLAPTAPVTESLGDALNLALRGRLSGETIVIAGTLYLVGEARALLASGRFASGGSHDPRLG